MMPVDPLTSTSMAERHNCGTHTAQQHGECELHLLAHSFIHTYTPLDWSRHIHGAMGGRVPWIAHHTVHAVGASASCQHTNTHTPTPCNHHAQGNKHTHLRQDTAHKLRRQGTIGAMAVENSNEHLFWLPVLVNDNHRVLQWSPSVTQSKPRTREAPSHHSTSPQTWFSFDLFIGSLPGREKHAKVIGSACAFVSPLLAVKLHTSQPALPLRQRSKRRAPTHTHSTRRFTHTRARMFHTTTCYVRAESTVKFLLQSLATPWKERPILQHRKAPALLGLRSTCITKERTSRHASLRKHPQQQHVCYKEPGKATTPTHCRHPGKRQRLLLTQDTTQRTFNFALVLLVDHGEATPRRL